MLEDLISAGLISGIVGPLPANPQLAICTWARTPPKPVFHSMVAIARHLSAHPVGVFIDDICTRVVTGRSADEQRPYNNLYIEYFTKLGLQPRLSSGFADEIAGESLCLLVRRCGHVNLSAFQNCLPEGKRGKDELALSEVLHAVTQLRLYEAVSDDFDAIVTGQFSRAILSLHRQLSASALSAILIPRISEQHNIWSVLDISGRLKGA